MEKKRCIVNYADRAGWYLNGQERLKRECPKYFSGDLITINDCVAIGSPTHQHNPYAFKIYSIEHARNLGYTSILYIDASIYPIKNIDAVFDHIEEHGKLMQHSGHSVDRWCNDNCRNYFGLSHEESEKMQMYSAGFTGLDLTNERSVEYLKQWKQACIDGAFHGNWNNHRHDMSAGSIIANRLNMPFESFHWFAYVGPGYAPVPEDCYFLCVPC